MEFNINKFDQAAYKKELIKALNENNKVDLSFSYPNKKIFSSIYGLMSLTLGNKDIVFIFESIVTVLREAIINAIKANAKRLYFETSNQDITNPEVYSRVMKNFREEIIGDLTVVEEQIMKSPYVIDFSIEQTSDAISVVVSNNVPMLKEEEERIAMRIANAVKFKDFSEAYETMYDETEGAGLGLILTIFLLKNIGVPTANFNIGVDGNKTRFSVKIPFQLKPNELTTEVKEQILKEIHVLPTFPQNVVELQLLAENPNSEISVLAEKIHRDPSLSADILKMANSAGFVAMRKIETINDALMRIGLVNLKYMLIAASSKKILDQRYKKFEQIWNHCLKAAFYGRQIAILTNNKKIVEKAFISSLLHDIGKIVLLSVDLSLTNWIADFVKQHGIRSTTILEEVSLGISHASIGKLIAERWNFADFITSCIAYHHSPYQAPEEFKDLIYITYLANLFCGIEARRYEYSYIDPNVIQFLNFKDENDAMELHKKLIEMHKTLA